MTEDATSTSPHGGRLRVFLAEDSAIMLSLLQDLLANEGNVEVCGHAVTASRAVAEMTASPPDVAIVDIALENSSGFDVLKALSAMPEDRRPVVIVLTNFTLQRYRVEAERLGARHFFDKNGQIVDLLRTIGAMAAARRAGEESGS